MSPELRLATAAEQRERDALTFPEWGQRLTLPQYLEREQALRAHPFSRGLRTWLLAQGPTVLASCETYLCHSRLGAQRGASHAVASVFVAPHLRGRGHASHLLDTVVSALEGQAVVLFSDVGERIYQRSGFVGLPAVDWVLEPSAGPLSSAELEVPLLEAPPAGVLQLEPTFEQLDWAHAREALYARWLRREPLFSHAAAAGAARACWAAYFKSNELIVLWLRPGAPADTRAVLAAAQAQAHASGLDRVRLWAPAGLEPPLGVRVRPRRHEVPMVRALGGHRVDGWEQVQRALWV